MNEVLPLFYTAMQLDPEFASAHAMAAWCHFWRKINGWMTDWPIAEGVRLARLAVDVNRCPILTPPSGGQYCRPNDTLRSPRPHRIWPHASR